MIDYYGDRYSRYIVRKRERDREMRESEEHACAYAGHPTTYPNMINKI